jgi:hypothetical protein
VEEIALPSSHRDLVNIKHAYLAMLAFSKKVEITKRKLDDFNRKRVASLRKRDLDLTPELEREKSRFTSSWTASGKFKKLRMFEQQ